MSFSRNRRDRRPVIEPIQTRHANILGRQCRVSKRRLNPLSQSISPEIISLASSMTESGNTKRDIRFSERHVFKKLNIQNPSSDGVRSPNPAFDHPACFGSFVRRSVVMQSPSERDHHMSDGRGNISMPNPPNTLRVSVSVTVSTNYSPTPSPGEIAFRRRQRTIQAQRSCEELWNQGYERFGSLQDAQVFVRPLPLGSCDEGVRSSSQDPGTSPAVSSSSTLPSPGLPNPTPASSRRLSVQTVIHSEARLPFGMSREFDLDMLRSTIPEPPLSRRSPNFDPEALLSKLQPVDGERQASYPPDSASINAGDDENGNKDGGQEGDEGEIEKSGEAATSPRPSERQQCSTQPITVPINCQYARAYLPALASVCMSGYVRQGDTIELVMPHPQAWPLTVAYVYTGEEEFITDQVKENVLHLGGKI